MELPPLSDMQIKTYREAFSRFVNSREFLIVREDYEHGC